MTTDKISIPEASKHLEKLEQELDIPQRENERKAVKLGKEALNRIKSAREMQCFASTCLLPGETEE